MLQYAIGRGVVPYLATVPPMVSGGSRALNPNLVSLYNSLIRGLASELRITLVDVAAAFGGDGPLSSSQLISVDGLHPNAQGYSTIASTFFASLKATLEQAQTSNLIFGMPTVRRLSSGRSGRP
jgi:lysophospholipase L1-like esterase